MANQHVTVTVAERIATVTLNNPPSNLLSTPVLQELDQIFGQLEADDAVRVIILTAGGKFFCPGADIKELAQLNTVHQGSELSGLGQALLNRIERFDKPVIATNVGGLAEVVVNEESDNRRRVPMLDEVKTNLGQVAEATVADGGYKSSVAWGEAEQKGYAVLVNWGGDASGQQPGPYHKSQFRHPAAEDVVICPGGERLEFEGIKTNRGKRYAVRGYRCRNFRQCPVRAECSPSADGQGRLIEISPYDAAVEKQRANRRDPQKQKLLKKRKVIVEPIFGVIKQAWGFRRWTLRGLENVRTQWSMICTAFNLKRMQKAWTAGRLALA